MNLGGKILTISSEGCNSVIAECCISRHYFH